MGDERVLVQVRLPKALVKQLDHLAIDWGTSRARLIEHLIQARLGDGRPAGPATDREG